MLKLHRLEISGFKTFVDPVEVSFADGITAIVGPNGCGKSNLADAITWVLGEQSAKSLRGSKMEDVIFSGSQKRKPIGMAEVTLELLTHPSFEHSVEGKMRIGRRVFRSGESQYRLNGKLTRLKAIKDLLMDTGLGIRAYSVIEQGKIGMILSGKPQERRKLLEEAAGITRYKARKRIAELKLEEATANLLRLDDILSEVERALRSLKRQANAARRYRERELEFRSLLRRVLFGRWSLLRSRLESLETRLAEETARDAALGAELHRGEASLAAGREELDRMSGALAESHQRQADLAATIEGRHEFVRGSRQTLREIAERLARGREQSAERDEVRSGDREALGGLDRRTLELIAERDEAARIVAEDERRIAVAQSRVQEAEARLEGLRQQLMGSLARVNRFRSQLQNEEVEIERKAFRRRYLDEEQTRLDAQLREARAGLEEILARISRQQAELEEKLAVRQTLGGRLEEILKREAAESEKRRELEAAIHSKIERRKILEELAAEHAERRRSLVETLASIGLEEPRFLADQVQGVEGWERGVDHFLAELADAVILGRGEDGLELARALSHNNSSGVFLRPLAAGSPASEVEDPALCGSLAEALGLAPELGRALPPAYLVREAAEAERLAAAHPGVAFISRDRLWALGGTLRVQREGAAPGVLARESELETLGRELPRLEGELARAAETLEGLVAERTGIAAEIHRLDEEIARLRRDLAVAQARRQDAAARHEKLDEQHRTVAEEQEEIAAALTSASEAKRQLSDRLAEEEETHRRLTEGLDQAQSAVESTRGEREVLATAGAGRRGRLELLEERLESHNQEAARVRRQIEEAARQEQSWRAEEESLELRRRELELGIAAAEEALQVALEEREAAQERVLADQATLDRRREKIRELETKVRKLREEREGLRNAIEELRVERAGIGQDAEHQSATYRAEFQKALPGTLGTEDANPPDALEAESSGAEAGVAPGGEEAAPPALEEDEELEPIDAAELAELETEMARVKAVLERLGPVNLLAAKEYDEQQERGTFLSAQRADVAASVASLRQTIEEINETSSARFLETFVEVNRAFGETFTRLFRGGEAHMGLLDESDPLDSGIEITARPPGKRPQNIMLLSGGEKALAAIALLFALFKTKPSPFCILDEVDAPLDDANILRFVDTLQEMAVETQFLVVTHNKLTMETAGTLYGVTMEEKGVSKLVSVEVENLHAEPQAATA